MTKRTAQAAGWVAGTVLAATAGSAAGGVYIGAENEAIHPMRNAAPQVEFSYQCTNAAGGGVFNPGDALRYCPTGMQVEVSAHNPLRIGSTRQTIGSWSVNGSSNDHCAADEAVVWTVFTVPAEGEPGVGADIRQESYCEPR